MSAQNLALTRAMGINYCGEGDSNVEQLCFWNCLHEPSVPHVGALRRLMGSCLKVSELSAQHGIVCNIQGKNICH